MFKSNVFKEVFYQSRIPQLIMSLDMSTLQYNTAFCRFIGYTHEELKSITIRDFSHPDDIDKDFLQLCEMIENKRTEYEMEKRYIHRSGEIKTGILNVSQIKDVETGDLFILGQVIDITETKNMSQSLKESEQKYRLLAEHSQDLIFLHNNEGDYQYVSPSVKSVLGYSQNEMVGSTPYDLIHPDDNSMVRELQELMLEKKEAVRATYRGRKSNGEYIWLESIIKPVCDKQTGEVTELISVTRDIEQRIETQEKLRKSEKLAVLGQMAAAVAHEIRNPLTPIKGFLQLLSKDNELNPAFITIILDELQRIETIISEFLSMAKPHNQKMSSLLIDELVKQVIQLYQTQAMMKNKEITLEVKGVIKPTIGDQNSLKQVFVNVMQNAFDATDERGKITVSVYNFTTNVCIEIHDDGCGIPKERLSKLGEPFYSTKEKGTGLGLMTSYKIIEDHHGKIMVDSLEGKGTKVTICLPMVRKNA